MKAIIQRVLEATSQEIKIGAGILVFSFIMKLINKF
jgi:hypothetical protein